MLRSSSSETTRNWCDPISFLYFYIPPHLFNPSKCPNVESNWCNAMLFSLILLERWSHISLFSNPICDSLLPLNHALSLSLSLSLGSNVKIYFHRCQYNLKRTTYNLQRTTYNIQHKTYIVQHTTYNVQHTRYDIRRHWQKKDGENSDWEIHLGIRCRRERPYQYAEGKANKPYTRRQIRPSLSLLSVLHVIK